MGLHKWIYRGRLKKHLVEVNHSPDSGKLMIKLNGEMMLYDYGITQESDQDRNYFFIIDGALCSVNVSKRKNKRKYNYDFLEEQIMSGKKLQAPTKSPQRKIYWFFGIIIFLLITIALSPFYRSLFSSPVDTLLIDGSTTIGTITFDDPHEHSNTYFFFVNGIKITGQLEDIDTINGKEVSPLGLPFRSGDKFEVLYNKDDVNENKILLDRPSLELLNQYKKSVADEFKIKHNDLKVNMDQLNGYCECLAETIYDNFGLKGLSLFFNNLNVSLEQEGFKFQEYQNILTSPMYFSKELDCREDHLFPHF